MSGVEAAASLFGSDDPASDPFGSLGAGNNEVAGESVPQQQHGTVSQQQEQAPGAADLFSGGDSSYPEFGAVGGHSGQQDYSSWPAATQEVNGYNPQDYYQAPATANSGYVDAQASQVGYGAFVFRLLGMKPTGYSRSTTPSGLLSTTSSCQQCLCPCNVLPDDLQSCVWLRWDQRLYEWYLGIIPTQRTHVHV